MNNKYTQDKTASAEILRLILQKMPGHHAAFIPSTYAVWYEFLTGINPPLNEAMNKLLNGKELLTTEAAQELFNRYISEGNPEAQNAFRQDMQKLLDNLAKFAESTGSETDRFSANLQKYGENLSDKLDAPALKSLVSEIVHDTQSMRGSVELLQGKLRETA